VWRAFSGGEREIVPAILHEELLSQPRVAAARGHLKRADQNPGRIGSERFVADSGHFEIVADAKSGRRLMRISVAKPRTLEAKVVEADCYHDVRSETAREKCGKLHVLKQACGPQNAANQLQAILSKARVSALCPLSSNGRTAMGSLKLAPASCKR
jgi:hypothetical protein